MTPAYNFEEFWELCRSGRGVEIWEAAEDDAYDLFRLDTWQSILRSIASADVANRRRLDTEPLRDYDPRGVPVDSYDFNLWRERVYIAFYKDGEKWILKSYKRQTAKPIFNDQAARVADGQNTLQQIRGLK